MATLAFWDTGGDHYGAILDWWDTHSGAYIETNGFATGYNTVNVDWGEMYVRKNVGTQTGVWWYGFRFKTTGGNNTNDVIWAVLDNGSYQLKLKLQADGLLRICRLDTTLATSTFVLPFNDFNTFKMEFRIGDVTGVAGTWGYFKLWINGTSVFNLTDVDTSNTAFLQFSQVQHGTFGGVGNNVTRRYRDMWLQTTELGVDPFFRRRAVNGDVGGSIPFTPNPGGTHYTTVDEAVPNGDTDYIESGTVSDIELHTVEDVATTAVIKTVIDVYNWKKTDTGARVARGILDLAGVQSASGDFALTTSYAFSWRNAEDAPGSSGWTPTQFNAIRKGPKVQS